MHPTVARKTWRTLEPIHGLIYFAPEASEAYVGVGLPPAMGGYFASRAAALGPVPAEVVIATFFNFYPPFVRETIPSAWSIASPAAILEARHTAAEKALRARLGDLASGPDLEEAAVLARRAAESATQWPEGRPLFAAHASLPWPDDPLMVLWHAQTLLREFRGDGHIAAMTVEGVGGVEALILHGATGEVPPATLRSSRQWPKDEWSTGEERLRSRGWLDDEGGLTDAGRTHRQWVEDRTDVLAAPAYDAIGEEGCERLRTLCRPMSKAIVEGGAFGFPPMRLVLWDIDGTLVRVGDLGRGPFQQAIVDTLGRDLGPEFHRRVRMSGKTDPQIARELLIEAEVHADEVDTHLPDVLRRLEEHLLAAEHLMQDGGHATAGGEAALTALAGRDDVVQSVLTGNLAANAVVKLRAFGLDRHIDFDIGAYGSDHHDREALVPIALTKAATKHGVTFRPEDTWVVGDTPRDFACAKAGGARCVLVATGGFGREELEGLGADAVLDDLSDTDAVVSLLTSPS